MVAGPLTGAEGDKQTGTGLPDLRLWPEFGIPAQRAEQTPFSGHVSEGTGKMVAADTGAGADAGVPAGPAAPGADPGVTQDPRNAQIPQIPQPTAPAAGEIAAYGTPAVSRLGATGLESGAVGVSGVGVGGVELSGVEVGGYGAAAAPEISTYGGEGGGADGTGGVGPGGEDGAPPAAPRRAVRRRHRSSMRRQTSHGIAVLAALAVIFLVLHRFLPDADGVGSMLETWLPWLGVPVGVLLIAAGIVHTRTALVATLVAAAVWTALYGPTLLPRGSSAPAQLRVFSEDVNGNSGEATTSGSMAMAEKADVVALEDMYSSVSGSSAVDALNTAYPNHVTEYEFGLWSRYKISDVTPIALSTGQPGQPSSSAAVDNAGLAASSSDVPVIGALEATLHTPYGDLVVYLVHLPQPVLGNQGFAKARDQALSQFVSLIEQNPAKHLAVIGDINVAATDRQFSQLTRTDGLTSAQQAAGSGFGFTWPAEFPVVRLDDVLTRGMTPLRSVVLPSIASGQTHLPIQVDLDY